MALNEYETTLIIRPDISGEQVESILDRVRDILHAHEAKLLAIRHWGKKKLAYEIQKHIRGMYINIHYLADNTVVAELERTLRILDPVLRFLTIRLAQGVLADERQETAYVRPAYDAEPDEPALGAPESQIPVSAEAFLQAETRDPDAEGWTEASVSRPSPAEEPVPLDGPQAHTQPAASHEAAAIATPIHEEK